MGKLATCKAIFRLLIVFYNIEIFSSHLNILFASSSTRFCYFFSYGRTHRWATCPDGYFMNGLFRTDEDPWLHNIEEARCCKPEGLPDEYADCYKENVWGSFDSKGLSVCKREGYYMTGIYRSNCDKLHCLEEFMCCRMIGNQSRMISYLS